MKLDKKQKLCNSCKRYKPLSDFYQLKSGKYRTRCKECEKRIRQEIKLAKKQEERLLNISKSKVQLDRDFNKYVCSRCLKVISGNDVYPDKDGTILCGACRLPTKTR